MSEDDVLRGGGEVAARAPRLPVGRRFGDEEINRILQTAADLQERSDALISEPGRGLTLGELRAIAEEAGIDPRFVDLAASHSDEPLEQRGSRLAGGGWSWHFRTTVPGEIGDADRERILHAIRSVMGHKGELEDVFGRMEWSHDDGVGPIIIGVSSRDSSTEVDVSAVKSSEAGLLFGLSVPFGGIFGGAAVAGLLGVSGPAAFPIIVGMSGVSYGLARIGWRLRSRWWERRLRRVRDRLSSVVQGFASISGPAEED